MLTDIASQVANGLKYLKGLSVTSSLITDQRDLTDTI